MDAISVRCGRRSASRWRLLFPFPRICSSFPRRSLFRARSSRERHTSSARCTRFNQNRYAFAPTRSFPLADQGRPISPGEYFSARSRRVRCKHTFVAFDTYFPRGKRYFSSDSADSSFELLRLSDEVERKTRIFRKCPILRACMFQLISSGPRTALKSASRASSRWVCHAICGKVSRRSRARTTI